MKLIQINLIQGANDNGTPIPHGTAFVNFEKIDHIQPYRLQSRNGTYHEFSYIRCAGSSFQVDIPYANVGAWVEEHSKVSRPNLRSGGNV